MPSLTARVPAETIGLALVLVLAAAGGPPEPDRHRKDLVGQPPPELVGAGEHWLAGPPVTLAGLKGKVVWLQFNF